ncbi:hypothetical protein ACP70R_048030 [Stipagrostis hirtigluma subsp. patula]
MDKSKNDPRSLVHKKWSFSLLQEITENFSKKRLIADGGVGPVYKGFTQDRKLMAVKRFKEYSEEQFKCELDFNHKNIVQPTGYCEETVRGVEEKILCYELLPGRSLDEILHDESDLLDWPKRYHIIEGICQGLNYLHENYEADAIVHMDIKPGNIVLAIDGMVPKIGSFNQSRRIPTEQAHTFCESRESMAPHCMNKKKSDIYNLGILIMEIVTKRRPSRDNEESTRSYIDEVQKDIHRIASDYKGFERQVENCIYIAMECVENNAQYGLIADEVIRRLETECSSKTEDGREYNTRGKKRAAEEMFEGRTKQRQLESSRKVQKNLFPAKTECTKTKNNPMERRLRRKLD